MKSHFMISSSLTSMFYSNSICLSKIFVSIFTYHRWCTIRHWYAPKTSYLENRLPLSSTARQ